MSHEALILYRNGGVFFGCHEIWNENQASTQVWKKDSSERKANLLYWKSELSNLQPLNSTQYRFLSPNESAPSSTVL